VAQDGSQGRQLPWEKYWPGMHDEQLVREVQVRQGEMQGAHRLMPSESSRNVEELEHAMQLWGCYAQLRQSGWQFIHKLLR